MTTTTHKRRDTVYMIMAVIIAALLFAALCFACGDSNSRYGLGLFEGSPYNSYSLQAQRWLSGHADLGRDYSHLEIAEYQSKYYISFPPFPSVVMLPFVLLFGANTPDRLLTFLFMCGGFVFLTLLFKRRMNIFPALFWAFFVAFGSNLLGAAVLSGVWFIAQTLCFMLSCMALWCIDSPRRAAWPWAFALLAMAVGCRPLQAVYFPVLLFILYRNLKLSFPAFLKSLPRYLTSAAAIALIYMAYNYIRFDNPFEFGHNYLPEMLDSVQAPHGQFSFKYIFGDSPGGPGSNLSKILRLPEWKNGRLEFPMFNGFFFLLANPFFISAFASVAALMWRGRGNPGLRKRYSSPLLLFILASCLLHLTLLLCHNTNGGWHFGVRYFCDALPFLSLLLFARQKPGRVAFDIPIAAFAVALQCYGTLLWLK